MKKNNFSEMNILDMIVAPMLADVKRWEQCGAEAILVGESLIKGGNISEKVSELLDD